VKQNLYYLSHYTLIVLLHYLVKYQTLQNFHAQDLSLWSKLSCKTQPLRTVLLKFLTVILALFIHWLKDTQSGHTKIPTVWLYASAATQKKRYFSKVLLHMISGPLVTSCLQLRQMFTDFKNCLTSKLNNKSVVKWLLNSPPHLKHVAALPCDLLLITMHATNFRYFPIRMFHKVVQRHVRCGGIVNDDFVAYLLVNLTVKKVWKSVNIWRRYGQYYRGMFILTHSVYRYIRRPVIIVFQIQVLRVSSMSRVTHRQQLTVVITGWTTQPTTNIRL